MIESYQGHINRQLVSVTFNVTNITVNINYTIINLHTSLLLF